MCRLCGFRFKFILVAINNLSLWINSYTEQKRGTRKRQREVRKSYRWQQINSNAHVFKTTLGDRCFKYAQEWKGIGRTGELSPQDSTGAFREKGDSVYIYLTLFFSKLTYWVQKATWSECASVLSTVTWICVSLSSFPNRGFLCEALGEALRGRYHPRESCTVW